MLFQLHDFINGKIQRTCQITNPKGNGVTNALYEFEPGEVYETNDPIFAAYISFNGVGDVREHALSTPDLREMLEAYRIPYETHRCGTCSGAKPKLYYNPFKILDERISNETA